MIVRRAHIVRSFLVAAAVLNVIGLVAIAAGTDRIDAWWTVVPEANLFTWLTAAALLVAAAGLLALREGRPWWLAGAIVALASIDEVSAMHEQLDFGREGSGVLRNGWLLLGVPLGIVIAVLLFRWATAIDAALRRQLAVAAAIYASGAVVVEGLTGVYEEHKGITRGYWLLSTVEENLELLGVLLVVHVVLGRLAERGATVEISL